jgi:drug/metabolite transporter (DMT)-like permease
MSYQEYTTAMTIYLSVCIILLTAIGQIFLKMGAGSSKRVFFNKYVILGYSLFIIVTCLSMILVNYLPLKSISIIVSFCYPATILFAGFFLKERITLKMLLACLIIVTGGIVFNL